jgi:NMD protein affecting ribosome stability and mRNA decay
MKDEWNERLRCPICGKAGMASLCQDEDSETLIVQSVPSGFKVVGDEYGPDFHCTTCNVAVVHRPPQLASCPADIRILPCVVMRSLPSILTM